MRRYLPLMMCVWLLTAGCAQLPVYRIPGFLAVNEIDSLAVTPFKATHRAGDAGYVLAERLAAAMAVNGTYDRVYAHDDRDFVGGGFGDDRGFPADARAILTGTVTQYVAESVREIRHEPIDGNQLHHRLPNDHPHAPRRFKPNAAVATRRVVFIHNEATLAVTATLRSAETGEILHVTYVPIGASIISEGSPPEWTLDQCLDIVIDQLVSQLVAEFAVTTGTVTVDPGKAMIISDGERKDDKWRKQDKFSPDDQEMLVVITLPNDAHLNVFDIIVRRKDHPETLAAETISWDMSLANSGLVLVFSPADLAARGGGLGKYEVVFYSGDEKVMKQDFKIVETE